jgi:hypothetical protein
MARRTTPRRVTYLEPVPPRLAPHTIIDSTSDVGRRFLCTMRVERGELDRAAVIRPVAGGWHPRMPEAPRRGGAGGLTRRPRCGFIGSRGLTIGAGIAVADAMGRRFRTPMSPIRSYRT